MANDDLAAMFEQEGVEPPRTKETEGKTSAEVAKLLGIPASKLSEWVSAGYLAPDGAGKSGKRCAWSDQDIAQARDLVEAGDRVRPILSLALVVKGVAMRRTCLKDQVVVVTSTGPRILHTSAALSELARISREPMLILP